MDNQSSLRRGLRQQKQQSTVPSKFNGTETATDSNIKATVDDLKCYAHMYATIHKTGVPDIENPMTSDLVANILIQYHLSKGLNYLGIRVKMMY